jgi:PAS domain-containing protein
MPALSPRSRPLAEEAGQQSEAHARLFSLTVPANALLELEGLAIALWNHDRAHCVFNRMTAELLAFEGSRCSADREFWLAHVDARDRERMLDVWRRQQGGEQLNVSRYRFLPLNGAPALQLEETAVRFPVPGQETSAVLCRYRRADNRRNLAKDRNCPSTIGELVHRIGNSLQVIRGETDLLRLFGSLPQQNFENISRAVECILQLAAEIDRAAETESKAKSRLLDDFARVSRGGAEKI